MYAAQYGADGITKFLLESGADPNARDTAGNCALHYAAGFNKLSSVKILFNAETATGVMNKKGQSPLEMALYHDHLEIAEYMMEELEVLGMVNIFFKE